MGLGSPWQLLHMTGKGVLWHFIDPDEFSNDDDLLDHIIDNGPFRP